MSISESRTEKAIEFVRDHAAQIGQLRGQKEYIAHRIKIERGQRFLEAEGTVAEREALAWTDSAVARLCEEYRDCVTELETLATRFKAAELTIDVWRTQSSNARRGNI